MREGRVGAWPQASASANHEHRPTVKPQQPPLQGPRGAKDGAAASVVMGRDRMGGQRGRATSCGTSVVVTAPHSTLQLWEGRIATRSTIPLQTDPRGKEEGEERRGGKKYKGSPWAPQSKLSLDG